MIELPREPRSSRRTAVAAVVTVILLATTGATAGIEEAVYDYKKAEKAIENRNYEKARERLNRAIAEHPQSLVYEQKPFDVYYFPHWLRGRVHLLMDSKEQAIDDFRKELELEVIQQYPSYHQRLEQDLDQALEGDTTDPALTITDFEVVEIRPGESPDGVDERVVIEIEGFVIEAGGLDSLTVNGEEIPKDKSEAQPDRHEFSHVTTAPPNGEVVVTARDLVGREDERRRIVAVPPLDLGKPAELIHALVVGVNTLEEGYLDGGECKHELREECPRLKCYVWNKLSAAAEDARRFARLLRMRGVPDENVTLLVSEGTKLDATRERIHSELERLKSVPGGTAIFYYAGHGVRSRTGKNLLIASDVDGYECVSSTDPQPTALERSAVHVDDVYASLETSPFLERYIILDACRTPPEATRGGGSADDTGFTVRGSLDRLRADRVRSKGLPPVVLFATQDDHVSVEWADQNAGYFTWFLVQGLRQDMDLRALDEWLQTNVSRQTATDCGLRQDCVSQNPYIDFPDELKVIPRQRETFILKSDTRRP